jgi:hypothetical protein
MRIKPQTVLESLGVSLALFPFTNFLVKRHHQFLAQILSNYYQDPSQTASPYVGLEIAK